MAAETQSPRASFSFQPLSLSLRLLRQYQVCDALTEVVLDFMILFSPWAFGTTEPWSIWIMNYASYLAGLLFAIKLAIRSLTGYRNPRWGRRTATGHFLTRSLAIISVMLVGYCLVSALNSRALYLRHEGTLEYFKFIPWLPHSYDQASSWQAFYRYLAFALVFWAARDWFLGKTPAEERAERSLLADPRRRRASLLPDRLRRVLWLLTINGGLLGLEGILQRINGTANLLFFRPTVMNRQALSQFGPYAYRSNAAQYFNLLWPVSLGLWWSLERAARRGVSKIEAFGLGSRHFLLVCVMIMASCPLISVSRVGAVVAMANLVTAVIIIWSAQGKEDRKTKAALVGCLIIVLGFSAMLSWNDLAPRFESENFDSSLDSRNSIYDMARPMADDSPLFGTGPGTFGTLFQLFRPDPEEYWPAQVHNDWLETLITFGWMGSVLIAAALGLVLSHWFFARGIYANVHFMLLCWAALAGCLFYARYDFPFQIYSIVFLFTLICAALFTFAHER